MVKFGKATAKKVAKHEKFGAVISRRAIFRLSLMIQYNLLLTEDKNIKKRIQVSLRFPLILFVDTSNGIILVTVLKKIKSTKNSIRSSAFHVTQKTA